MKFIDIPEPLASFLINACAAGKFLGGSGVSFMIAQVVPEEQGLIKIASALTGWGLAIACIYTLVKAVRILFAKLEEKDKVIADLHATAISKAEGQRKEMLDELRIMNSKRE